MFSRSTLYRRERNYQLLLAAVQPPTLWWWIDVSGNRRRHPAETVAKKDQQDWLHALAASDHQCKYENNCPDDSEACAVDPKVSESKHLMPLFLSKDTIYKLMPFSIL